ncbi:MAG: hypothetical protein CUN56_07830 [Phototrophicales bacterium]|nr:MAG: hypothetical protein CUN56_07830 [Phototrophicales bacterium]
MTSRKQAILDRLAESRTYLDQVLDQVGDRWEQQVYSDGLGWTVRQLVAHLADAERGHYLQVTNIAEGKDLIPEDFDVERYNKRVTEKTADVTPTQAREQLATYRQQLNDWLAQLDEAKLDQKGRHASLQIMTVEQILGILSAHEHTHAADIAKALNITL